MCICYELLFCISSFYVGCNMNVSDADMVDEAAVREYIQCIPLIRGSTVRFYSIKV